MLLYITYDRISPYHNTITESVAKMMPKNNDFFADIAKSYNERRKELLTPNLPMPFIKKACELKDDTPAAAVPTDVMHTAEQLRQELTVQRRKYAPFLRNLAPDIPSFKHVTEIKDFTLNGTEQITLPHYGNPVGNAEQTYEASFHINDDLTDKAVYLCFGGADYYTTAYINDDCVGMHEGFFSPFEFEITDRVTTGKNKLKIVLKNDYVIMGNTPTDPNLHADRVFGDKLYAATGLGWDDPQLGWHHCPPGMGIYGHVRVEVRNRLHITDLYVRPLPKENKAEICIDVQNADYLEKALTFSLSVYAQNFEGGLVKKLQCDPYFSFTKECVVDKADRCHDSCQMTAHHGSNLYKLTVAMDDAKLWEPETPYLYQIQAELFFGGEPCDAAAQQFGMRTFEQDVQSVPKGNFYLNGRKIKLRGANTMGFEQQDVLRGDYEQLIDDILLAKICNMNFWRLTQRPVQDEVYTYCDRLGLMTQTDLPLFNSMRRTKFAEGVRQTEEMVRITRRHPCNIVITYINEPVPFGWTRPHRCLLRNELEDFFEACDRAAHLNDPDCVIKHIDGDYDPPLRTTLPDNHCYTLWYNGHGIDFGKLHKGYWLKTAADWNHACGEFGAEGLDYKDLMQRRYPKEWLDEPFSPGNIVNAQALAMHGNFYETPDGIDEWIEATQEHQAFATKAMTEAFRRDPKMISYAIHLFIDAWPSGWMKTIMDCERTPKKAYFAYRNACEPVHVSLRSDRLTYFNGERISIETYLCNDTADALKAYTIVYELYTDNTLIKTGRTKAAVGACDVSYIANAEFVLTDADPRQKYTLKAILLG